MVAVMRFDRKAPGEGVQVSYRLENGRLHMVWSFLTEECGDGVTLQGLAEEKAKEAGEMTIHLRLMDKSGMVALECMQQVAEEEPMQTILLQPRLWNGIRDPYLYRLEAFLRDGQGRCLDRVSRPLALRVWESREICGGTRQEFLLNGEKFEAKAVRYALPQVGKSVSGEAEHLSHHQVGQQVVPCGEAGYCESVRHRVREDMQSLVKLGANCVYLEECGEADAEFQQMCDSLGLTICGKGSEVKIYNVDKLPRFRCDVDSSGLGEEAGADGLFSAETGMPTSLYYRCKAKWSPEPFVYIVPESVRKLNSGNYIVTCYSNCNRVALYSDGTLFEFKKGEETFTFWEVPARTPCIMLAAEGEGCGQSFSFHKTFTKQSPNGDI